MNAASHVRTLLFMSYAVAMVTLGSIHVNDCPGERMLPIVLVVKGVLSVILFFDSHSCYYCCMLLLAFFWHVIGCFFVFRKTIYDSYNVDGIPDCSPTFFSFVLIFFSVTSIVLFTFSGLLFVLFCFSGCTLSSKIITALNYIHLSAIILLFMPKSELLDNIEISGYRHLV